MDYFFLLQPSFLAWPVACGTAPLHTSALSHRMDSETWKVPVQSYSTTTWTCIIVNEHTRRVWFNTVKSITAVGQSISSEEGEYKSK